MQMGSNGLAWLYSNTVGQVTSYFGDVTLSTAETFVLQFFNAGLSLFAYIIGQISSIGIYWANEMGYISGTMGLFGPFAAVFLAIALLIAMALTVKLLVVLL